MQKSSFRRKNAAPLILTGALILVLIVIGVMVTFFFFSWFQQDGPTASLFPSSMGGDAPPSENVEYRSGQVLPTWTGEHQVTVLVLGIDERSQEEGPWRTDTMMVLTLEPKSKRAGVLSIPRDLWVPIPGHKDGRINTAHFLGDLYDYPGGGPALAMETVEYNLGVPVNYFVRVNFEGFVKLVDLIGGIDVYVENTINDPTYPGPNYDYDPLYIEAGWHHFDGEMALKYARTRHGNSDFDRAHRQQQVMLAILNQVASLKLLPNLAKNASQIYDTLQNAIQTNLALDQMLALGALTVQVKQEDIRFGVINNQCTQTWITPDGAQVEVPIRDKMREVRDYVFWADQPTETPTQQSQGQAESTQAPMATSTPESATIAVLNGTTRKGLAGLTRDYLRDNGVQVTHVGNANRQDHTASAIVVYGDKPQTTAQLLALLNLPQTAIVRGNDENAGDDYDIIVTLGADYAGPPEAGEVP
jgi:LCP family protein required for cell wall assembly